jgi:ligand-binding sensor domain-containing protein
MQSMGTSTCFQPSVNMNRNKKSLIKFKISIFSTLSIVLFISSCNGQTSTTKTDKNIHSTKNSQQQPKLVRSFESKFENVSCQILDKDGNIWFSIRGEGAYRYNGKSFDKFTTKDGLCNNEVNAIIQNKKGNIIIGTTNGICQYDGQKFTKYPVPETLNISCLLEDKNENLWFGTLGNGVYRFNGSKLDNFQHSKEQIFNRGTKYQLILDILQDKKGNFWFSSLNEGGAWRYDGKELKNFLPTAEYYKTNQDKRKLINKQYGLEMSTSTHFDQVQNHITDDIIFSMMEIFGLLPETTVFVISMEKHLQVSG